MATLVGLKAHTVTKSKIGEWFEHIKRSKITNGTSALQHIMLIQLMGCIHVIHVTRAQQVSMH